jgi:hypothetical protein
MPNLALKNPGPEPNSTCCRICFEGSQNFSIVTVANVIKNFLSREGVLKRFIE